MEKSITILAGRDKDGVKENFGVIELVLGETVAVVGPTGSGKTALITDIELLANRDSITKRKILIDGGEPQDEFRFDPRNKPITMITQNTKCFSDLNVLDFLRIHIRARKLVDEGLAMKTIDLANKFTGEAILEKNRVTELSGGQTRALFFADAILIGSSPIVLLDEIENAGINKMQIFSAVKAENKLIIYVTHDPLISLQTDKRIIMKRGAIVDIITRNSAEGKTLQTLIGIEERINNMRNMMRNGESIIETILVGGKL